jgi:hypothetical protein
MVFGEGLSDMAKSRAWSAINFVLTVNPSLDLAEIAREAARVV